MMRTPATVMLLFIANLVWANESGGYIGASLGVSDTPSECTSDERGKRCEGNLVGGRGFLGYALNRNLAIEGGFNAIGGNGSTAGLLDLSGVASAPLSERAALFGRIGVVGDNERSDAIYGAGLRFDLEDKASLRLEWLHYGANGGADFLFLGILSRF